MGFAHGAGPRRAFLGPAGSSRGPREEGMALPEEEMAHFPPDTTCMARGTTGPNVKSGFKGCHDPARVIAAKEVGSRLAPPTRRPWTPGVANRAEALSGFTEPP